MCTGPSHSGTDLRRGTPGPSLSHHASTQVEAVGTAAIEGAGLLANIARIPPITKSGPATTYAKETAISPPIPAMISSTPATLGLAIAIAPPMIPTTDNASAAQPKPTTVEAP